MNDSSPPPPSETIKSGLSLFVIFHFFLIFLGMTSFSVSSQLQTRLNGAFGWYTQTFGLDVEGIPYHYTLGQDGGYLYSLEIEYREGPQAGEIYLPTSDLAKGSDNYWRLRNYVRFFNLIIVESGTDTEPLMPFLKAIGKHYLADQDTKITVRVLQHYLRQENIDEPLTPIEGAVFEADLWKNNEGKIVVIPIMEKKLTANVTPETPESSDVIKEN
ncbi:MAG: hypothetical protein MPJ24_04155 [Pirellulaceae bacterium]|nr:hypothetical protein [Pirellulaceae bacterium]